MDTCTDASTDTGGDNKNEAEIKLCKNCAYVGTNASNDIMKYKCFAPENMDGVSLLDGRKLYRLATCYDARYTDASIFAIEICGTDAAWYKPAPAPAPAPIPVAIPAPTTSSGLKIKVASNLLRDLGM